jgi:hypothetical protein
VKVRVRHFFFVAVAFLCAAFNERKKEKAVKDIFMKKTGVLSSVFCFFFLWASMSFSQQVAAPVYKEGNWWKIKVEVRYGTGVSKSGYCEESYSQYMVKVDQDQKKVYGIKDEKQEQLDCPDILEQLLGIETEPNSQKYLAYPLAVGKTWIAQVAEERERKARTKRANVRWLNLEYKVLAWEILKTPKGELGTFKIEVSGWPWGQQPPTYYYSPDAKAIVRLREQKERVTRIVTLLDYSVSK